MRWYSSFLLHLGHIGLNVFNDSDIEGCYIGLPKGNQLPTAQQCLIFINDCEDQAFRLSVDVISTHATCHAARINCLRPMNPNAPSLEISPAKSISLVYAQAGGLLPLPILSARRR
jgi:hypothetical protein